MIGIIYGALGCLAQRDMKRLIAFSSIAHMGFVMLGIATLTDFGINAAIFGMVAHGLITGMLFFLAGSIQERYNTRELSRLGGLLTQAPHLGWILGFCAMASLGLPGLAGFWGEFPAILSAYDPTKPERSVGWELGHALDVPHLHGDRRDRYRARRRLPALDVPEGGVRQGERRSSRISTCTTCTVPSGSRGPRCCSLIVVLGFYPNLVFKITDPAVTHIVNGMSKVI